LPAVWLKTRAHSRLTAVPLPSSFAPGAESVPSKVSLFRESLMAGYEHDAIRLFRVGPSQHRINIGDFNWFRNAVAGCSVKASVFTSRQPPQSLE